MNATAIRGGLFGLTVLCAAVSWAATDPAASYDDANAATAVESGAAASPIQPEQPAAPARGAPKARRIPVLPRESPRPAPEAKVMPKLAPATLSAEQIVEKNVAARGGLAAWRAVQTISMAGLMDAGRAEPPKVPGTLSPTLQKAQNKADAKKIFDELHGKTEKAETGTLVQLPFTMEQKRGRKQRVEIVFQGQTAVQVYDGENGWKVRPFLGRRGAEPFNDEQRKLAAQQQDLDGPLIDYRAKGTRIDVEGIEAVDGRDAYRLKLSLSSGAIRRVWVDAQSFLEVKIDGTRRLDGKDHDVATFLRDYRMVDGVLMPYLMETKVDGVPGAERIRVDTIALNPAIDDSRFAKPE